MRAFAVCSTIGFWAYVVVVPSIWSRSTGRLRATCSIRFRCSAWAAVYSLALVTISRASFPLRPWPWASPTIWATASCLILRARSEPMFWPLASIGVAAPMWVVGAIAATSDASVMYAPAEAARAPSGAT